MAITNLTNASLAKINYMANSTTFPEFMIKVNHTVYDGVLYFLLLFILVIILFVAAQRVKDNVLVNALFSFGSVTVLSFILRGFYIVQDGLRLGLLTDKQLWIFPIITIVLAVISWATKE